MTNGIRVLRPRDPEWGDWLRLVDHDFYHTAAYHAYSEQEGQGEGRLAVYGSPARFMAWPYLLCEIPGANDNQGRALYDVNSVYGYPGPLAYECTGSGNFIDQAWGALKEHWRANRVVTVFSRFHPLLKNHQVFADAKDHMPFSGELGARAGGRTISIDLAGGEEGIWSQLRPMWRRHIRRACQMGIATAVDQDWHHLDEFVRLYTLTMKRNGAAKRYFFDVSHVERLRQALPGHIHLHRAHLNGKTAAAVLISEYRGIAQYLYAGVNEEFSELSPLKVLLHNAASWASSRGSHTLHLGGGRGAQESDSLFFFKSGFSNRRHNFYTGRWIVDTDNYAALCRRRSDLAALSDTDIDTFFPAYRAPITTASYEDQESGAIAAR